MELRLTLPGTASAGTYSAAVKLAEPGGLAITKNVKAFVRLAVWVVWIAVAVGIIVGFILRRVLRRSREKAVLQRRTREIELALGDAVGDRPDEKTKQLLDAMFLNAATLDRRVDERSSDLTALAAEIDRLDARAGVVGLWIRQHLVAAAVKPPGIVADETEKLNRHHAELLQSATSGPRLTEIRTELLAIATALPKKIEAALRARAQELFALLDAHEPFLILAVRQRVPEVRERLEDAQSAITGGDYAGASTSLAGVEERIVGLLTEDLREFAQTLPTWVSQWATRIRSNVLAELDKPGSPRARYDAALRKLVQELVTYAKSQAGGLTDTKQKEDVLALLKQAEEKLASPSSSNTLAARALLEQAVQRANGFAQQVFRSANEVRTQRQAVPTAADIGTRLSAPSPVPLPDRLAQVRAELATIAKRMQMIEWVSLAVAAVVALVIATLVLYDRDWGTGKDFATAVAWGLGIQVGAGFTFSGIDSLLTQLQGAPTAAAQRA